MTSIAKDVLANALRLSEEDRAAVADELFASVDSVEDSDSEELLAELDRRAAELRADPGAGLSWDEVKKMR